MFLLLAALSTADAAPKCKVTLYEHAGFEGASKTFTTGSYDMSELGIPNDSLSSVRVSAGCMVTLYEHDFEGASRVLTHDRGELPDFNDTVSSLSVKPACTVTLYEHADYQGASKTLGVGDQDLPDLGIPNDSLSSVRVSPGCMVTVYEHGWSGDYRVLTQDTPFLSDFNDTVSTVRVAPACATTLYEHEGFEGRSQTIYSGDLPHSGLTTLPNDSLSSLRLSPGCVLTLFEHDLDQGAKVIYLASSPDMGDMNDRVSSARVR